MGKSNDFFCEDCIYFEDLDIDDIGLCKRHAPRPILGSAEDVRGSKFEETRWPFVSKVDWCGEFKS